MSSPFLFVFGDDRVTCHMGANDIVMLLMRSDGERASMRLLDRDFLLWFFVDSVGLLELVIHL